MKKHQKHYGLAYVRILILGESDGFAIQAVSKRGPKKPVLAREREAR